MNTKRLWTVVVAILLSMVIGSGAVWTPPAAAEILQQETAPGQLRLESRQTLQDQSGHSWQVSVRRDFSTAGTSHFCLHLIGTAQSVTFARQQPLRLMLSSGEVLTVSDTTCDMFTNASPAPYVAQYDLLPVVASLLATHSLQLEMPQTGGHAAVLQVPPAVLEEWQTVAACTAMYCDPVD